MPSQHPSHNLTSSTSLHPAPFYLPIVQTRPTVPATSFTTKMASLPLPQPRHLISQLISTIRTTNATTTTTPLTNATPQTQQALLTLHILFPNELLPALDLLDRSLITRLEIRDAAQHPQPDPRPLHHLQRQDRLSDHLSAAPSAALGNSSHCSGTTPTHAGDAPPASPLRRPRTPSHPDGENHQASPHQPLSSRPLRLGLGDGSGALPHGPPAHAAASQRGGVVWRCYSGRSGHASLSRVVRAEQRAASYECRLDAWSCSCPAFSFAAFPASTPDQQVQQHIENFHLGEAFFGGQTISGDVPVCKHLLACALVEYGTALTDMVERHTVSIEEIAGLAAGWAD